MQSRPQRSARDKANRAVQALAGLRLLVGGPGNDYGEVLAGAFATLSGLPACGKKEARRIYARCRRDFGGLLAEDRPPWLSDDDEAAWAVFYERFDLPSCQLRIFPIELIHTVSLKFVAKHFNVKVREVLRQPFSSELVLRPHPVSGWEAHFENPVKLMLLDAFLLFGHVRAEHQALVGVVGEKPELEEDPVGQWREKAHRGRLDAFVRQLIIAAVTALDGLLYQYGEMMLHMAEETNLDLAPFKEWAGKGLVARLEKVHELWRQVEPAPSSPNRRLEEELIALVVRRNRLVHPDSRPDGWTAF